MPKKSHPNSFLQAAAILTAANIIVRVLGFGYRIALTRLIGAEGLGLYQMVFPFGMVLVAIVTSGLPISTARLISQAEAHGDAGRVGDLLSASRRLALSVGAALTLLCMLLAPVVATHVLRQPDAAPLLIAFAPSILLMGAASANGSLFYGRRSVSVPAYSEVIEQVSRMAVVFAFFFILEPQNPRASATLALIGMAAGAAVALGYIHHKAQKALSERHHAQGITKLVVKESLPITAIRCCTTFLASLNAILVPQRLIAAGYTNSEALSLLGVIGGMVMPLLMLPSTVSSALSQVLVPTLSASQATKDYAAIRRSNARSIRMSLLFACAAAALFFPYAPQLCHMLFNDPRAGELLRACTPLVPLLCLNQIFSSMMHGLGWQRRAMYHTILGGGCALLCTFFLTAQPQWNIYGYVLGTYFAALLPLLCNGICLARAKLLRLAFADMLLPILASIAAMALSMFLPATETVLSMAVHIAATAAAYAIMTIPCWWSVLQRRT